MMEKNQLTLVIPTRYRIQYPKLFLSYYAEIQFPYTILIIDSNEDKTHIQRLIESFKKNLHLHYLSLPGLTTDQSIKMALDHIQTPYAMMVGDDELVLPKGLRICLDFLSTNKDFSAAAGETVWAKLIKQESKITLDPQRIDRGEMSKNIEQKRASDRLVAFFKSGGQCTFSMQRTENFKKNYHRVGSIDFEACPQTWPLSELSLQGLTAIRGKIKRVKGLSLVMIRDYVLQGAPNPARRISMTESITHPEWSPKVKQMIQLWSEEMSFYEKMDMEEAMRRAMTAFYVWLLHRLKMYSFTIDSQNGKEVLWQLLKKGVQSRLERRKKLPLDLCQIANDHSERYAGFQSCYQKLQQFCKQYVPRLPDIS